MTRYALTKLADQDISHIAAYSIATWGLTRAERYVLEMHSVFEHLAAFPDIGLDGGHLRDGYRRFTHDRHSIFYRKVEGGILIVRVLHQKQQPESNL